MKEPNRFDKYFNIAPAIEIKENDTLAKRYERYTNDNKHTQQLAETNLKQDKLLANYKQALSLLKPDVAQSLRVIDKNILVMFNSRLRLLTPDDFISKIKKETINKNYRDIRNYLRFLEQNYNLQSSILKTKKQTKSEISDAFPCNLVSSDYTDEAIKFLYELSLGNLKIVEDLAILAYEIRCSIPVPTVILADRSIYQELLEFLRMVSAKSFIPEPILYVDFKKIFKSEEFKDIASVNWNNDVLSAICIEGDIPENENKVMKLKKIMHGKTVSINHPYFSGKMFIKNHMPFIYITESHEKYLKMKNIYGAKGIMISSKSISHIYYNQLDNMWLQNNFVKFGLIRKNFKSSINCRYPKITEDDIFSAFLDELCIFDDKSDCPTQELYEAYCVFFKSFYGENPLTFRQFRTRFAIFAELDVCRPHHSNSSNPRCFNGIKINNERYKELLNSGIKNILICTKKEFTHRLFEAMRNEDCLKNNR